MQCTDLAPESGHWGIVDAHEDLLQVERHDLLSWEVGRFADGLQEVVSQGGKCRVLLTSGLLPPTDMWFTMCICRQYTHIL